MRPPHGRRPPSRHRPAPPNVTSTPLGEIAREYETWRQAQPGKPSRGALRDYWRPLDAKHGPRPDYLLWRQLQCPDCPPEKRQDVVELAARALKAREVSSLLPVLLLLAGWLLDGKAAESADRLKNLLSEAVKRLEGQGMDDAAVAWVLAFGRQSLETPGEAARSVWAGLFTRQDPAWKPGRDPKLPMADWFPVPERTWVRWMAASLAALPQESRWALSAWRLQRSLRPAGALIRPQEWEMLMNAASAARAEGRVHEALRLTALALHLLPDRAPEPLRQRARVAAWFLAEGGIEPPEGLRACLDDLPFPGELPTSEKGQEAARLFRDEADAFQLRLSQEVLADSDWQVLRAAGIALHHPLAALAWVGKRAQSYALKKQTDLLQAAARLALRHGAWGTLARIRAEFPESPEALLALAHVLREAQRHMPFLRDAAEGRRCAECLRMAWGRLDAGAVQDEEKLFFLHETLLDREATLRQSLPPDLATLAEAHLTSERRPSAWIQALDEEPRRMACLEHQRAVELWSVASYLREHAASWSDAVWVSLVRRGDIASGKYSWLMLSAEGGRRHGQGRLNAMPGLESLQQELLEVARSLCPDLRRILLASDQELPSWPSEVQVQRIPSWEAAFRECRQKAT